jgi:hypothetical protein
MCLQLADQTLCYPKGILEDVWIVVGHSYVLADFVIVEIGGDEKAPIILRRPFLSTTKAIIYADSIKICFTINGRKERFNFKKRTLNIRVCPQTSYLYEYTIAVSTKKKNNNRRRRNKAKHQTKETVWMVNTIDSELDHLLLSPYLTKLRDSGVPIIDCIIEGSTFYKTFCDIGSSTNIMSKVTYKHLYNTRSMYRTYV